MLSDSGASILIIGREALVEVDIRSNVKRVVITSSVATIFEPKDDPSYTFTEVDVAYAILLVPCS